MTDTFKVRRGMADDFELVLGMIDEAASWLQTKGTDQWATPWPTRQARDERVRRGLRNGDTWVVEDDGAAVATITYRRSGNQRLWGPQEGREAAVYVSRLIVRREYAGKGIGAALLDWAAQRAVRDWSAQWIRIDVWTTNVALHKYYENQGFKFCRICRFHENGNAQRLYPSAALFQKPTAKARPTRRFFKRPPTLAEVPIVLIPQENTSPMLTGGSERGCQPEPAGLSTTGRIGSSS